MTCQQVQTNLSLYLYGELDFAQEEAVERHLDTCAFCQMAFSREKGWHGVLNAEQADVPLSLLSECRRELSRSVRATEGRPAPSGFAWSKAWSGVTESLGLRATRWSTALAAASFLVFIGFSAGRLFNGFGPSVSPLLDAGVMGPSAMRVRDIQPDGKDRVHLTVEQVKEREITGSVANDEIRQLVLSATQDPTDPGLRLYSVEMLKGQRGNDIRNALVKSARQDPNAAVRLKALDGLRAFSLDPETLATLKFVLEHDSNPEVRSEAIDILAPVGQTAHSADDLAATLQDIVRSENQDEYVRARSLQMLREMNAPINVY